MNTNATRDDRIPLCNGNVETEKLVKLEENMRTYDCQTPWMICAKPKFEKSSPNLCEIVADIFTVWTLIHVFAKSHPAFQNATEFDQLDVLCTDDHPPIEIFVVEIFVVLRAAALAGRRAWSDELMIEFFRQLDITSGPSAKQAAAGCPKPMHPRACGARGSREHHLVRFDISTV